MVYLPGCPSRIEIWEEIRNYSAWLRNQSDTKLQKMQKNARNNQMLYNYLAYLYSDNDVFKYKDINFPLILHSAPKSQRYDLESVLGSLDVEKEEIIYSPFEQAGQEYTRMLLRSSSPPWDDSTYRVVKYNLADKIVLDCALGGYFNMLKTCDILEFEILTTLDNNPPFFQSDFPKLLNRLILRRFFHESRDSIYDPKGRSVAISISTLILYIEEGKYKILVRERSRDVAVHQHLLHIIPSFMFQPVVRCIKEEYSIRHNIYREYLEEVLNKKDLDRPSRELKYDFFYEDHNLQYLNQLEEKGDARFLFTGVSFNLLNFRPEIHTLLLITNPEWIINQGLGKKVGDLELDRFSMNWEFKHGNDSKGANFKSNTSIELTPSLEIPDKYFKPGNFVPVGAAGIKLGLDAAKEELGIT